MALINKYYRFCSTSNIDRKEDLLTISKITNNTINNSYNEIEKSRFVHEELLGTGEIFEVYEARDLMRVEWGDANPKVAIKRIKPKYSGNALARMMLVQEFCTLRHLIHPGIIRVYDLHPDQNDICFSMELLEGHTVSELIANNPGGMGKHTFLYAKKIFDTLSFLHEKGIVHGDIKPSNIFIASENRLVFLDFNVSTMNPYPGKAYNYNNNKLFKSIKIDSYNLLYAAPDRNINLQPSYNDDIFAACCITYEIATGRHPFNRNSSNEALIKRINPFQPICFSRQQWHLIQQGLSLNSKSRPDAKKLSRIFSKKKFFSIIF